MPGLGSTLIEALIALIKFAGQARPRPKRKNPLRPPERK